MGRLLGVRKDKLFDELGVGQERVDEQALDRDQGARGVGLGGAGLLRRAQEQLAGGLGCITSEVSLD